MTEESAILDLSFQFALQISDYTETLQNEGKFLVASELRKSGTGIGANVCRARRALDTFDFILEYQIASDKAKTCRYWMQLCKDSVVYPNPPEELLKSIDSIIQIISKKISTSKANLS